MIHRIQRKNSAAKTLSVALLSIALLYTGCAPTYPKEMVDKAIVQLCKEEYSTDVKVIVLGSTVGVYIPINELFRTNLAISKSASQKINDVLLGVTRVTLSTDAPLKFYIVIAQDPAIPEVEVVLVRYIKDVRMFHYEQISRGEFAKRLIVDVKLTPQAQKEKVLRSIFNKLKMSDTEDLISEYMRTSEVSGIGDMGFWQDTFYIKDIDMGEFLALQIAERVKTKFLTTEELKTAFKLNSIKGGYLNTEGKDYFKFSFDATSADAQNPYMSDGEYNSLFNEIVTIASEVMHGYKFNDFWNIEIENKDNGQILFVANEELEKYRNKKIKLEELRRWYK